MNVSGISGNQNKTSFGMSYSGKPIQKAAEQIIDFDSFASKTAANALADECDKLAIKLKEAHYNYRANPSADTIRIFQSLKIKYEAIYNRYITERTSYLRSQVAK